MDHRRREGSALVMSLFIVLVLSGVTVSIFLVNMSHKREVSTAVNESRLLYLADAGITEALSEMAASIEKSQPVPADVGTKTKPMELKEGNYYVDIADQGDGTYLVTSTGVAGVASKSVAAVVEKSEGVFDHAVFSGNSSGDPTYTMEFGGTGTSGDSITGNIYSGGDVEITGDATVSGDIHASGTITGGTGKDGKTYPIPDIAGMDYENNHDVDVKKVFDTIGNSVTNNELGGTAEQVHEPSPAHIFRRNPDDRQEEIDGTAKDDYFLEDPFMPVKDFTVPETGKEGHTISLSGTESYPGPSGTNKVYFIDGNLWVHNKPFGRLRFKNDDPEGAKVTFVVKGNVYFSDDVYIVDPAKDGVAFIAIKDDLEPDSGNIYLGDPRYGTLDKMEAFLYAENDFIDNNLSADGSQEVELIGNMTAGNHVAINRDFVDPDDGSVTHSKLTVTFDDRLSTGALSLPGLPDPGKGIEGFHVVLWRELGAE